MATEIQYQSQLPQLLTQLLGSKQTSSSTPGVTAPLEELFTSAMGASKAGVPEMQQLIASIFQEGATKVPELSHAFANATGSRTTGNASLALALSDLNRQLSSQAAQAVLTNQTNNRQIAANAGSGIAQATRGANTTQTTKAGVNPLLLSLLGTGVNKLDKLGKLDWLKSSPMAPVVDGVAIPVGDITSSGMDSFPEFSQPFPDIGGAGDFGSFGTDVLAGAADSFDFSSDIGFDAAIPDFDFSFFDPGFGTGADFGSLDLGSFLFADGGRVGSRIMRPRGYADGGSVTSPTVSRNRAYVPPQPAKIPAVFASGPAQTPSSMASRTQVAGTNAKSAGLAPISPEALAFFASQNPLAGDFFSDSTGNYRGVYQGEEASPESGGPRSLTGVRRLTGKVDPVFNLDGSFQAAFDGRERAGGNMFLKFLLSAAAIASGNPALAFAQNVGGQAASSALSGEFGGDVSSLGELGGTAISDLQAQSAAAISSGANPGPGAGAYRDGGKVKGPGTGTSDSIPARLSDGEYVIPADVVRRIGTDALDRLISGHMPAGISLAGEEDEDD